MIQRRWNWTLVSHARNFARTSRKRRRCFSAARGLFFFCCLLLDTCYRPTLGVPLVMAGELVVLPQRLVVSADYPARLVVLERTGANADDAVVDRSSSDQLRMRLSDRSGLQILPGGVIQVAHSDQQNQENSDHAKNDQAKNDQAKSEQQKAAHAEVTVTFGDQTVVVPIEISHRESRSAGLSTRSRSGAWQVGLQPGYMSWQLTW